MIKHAASGDGVDYTLCGIADDGENGDYVDAPEYAGPGEVVSCEDCRRIIKHCKQFKGYKQP